MHSLIGTLEYKLIFLHFYSHLGKKRARFAGWPAEAGVNIFRKNTISAPRLINFAPKNQDSSQQKNGNVQ